MSALVQTQNFLPKQKYSETKFSFLWNKLSHKRLMQWQIPEYLHISAQFLNNYIESSSHSKLTPILKSSVDKGTEAHCHDYIDLTISFYEQM